MNTKTSQSPVFQEFEKRLEAHKFYRDFTIENSIFFKYEALIFCIFGLTFPLVISSVYGLKWLWMMPTYLILHAIISVKIKNILEVKFLDKHPKEAIDHFGR